MKIRWAKRVKAILRVLANVPYVEEAASYIVGRRDMPGIPSDEIPDIAPIQPQVDTYQNLRLNLFIPSINVSDAFGGISTAVRIFERLGSIVQSASDVPLRIITDTRTTDESVVDLGKWRLVDPGDTTSRYQIL